MRQKNTQKKEVYNDANGDLVNLFRCVKYHPEEVQKELEFILMSREQFYDAKEQLMTRGMTDIQRAARFFAIVKESYGSKLNSFGMKERDMQKSKENLTRIAQRLNRVVIENLDFREIIKKYDGAESLFYADPPYYGTEKAYSEKFSEDDHVQLEESLRNVKGKFVLSYNDCDYIRDLYRDYRITEVERQNNLRIGASKTPYKELIIKNF